MKKKMMTLLLILVFITAGFTGCSKEKAKDSQSTGKTDDKKNTEQTADKSKKTEISMGRYMEHKVQLPEFEQEERVVKILQNSKKQMEVFTNKQSDTGREYQCYQLKDDKSWEKSKPKWLNNKKYCSGNYDLTDLCIGQDGCYYACFQCYDDNNYKSSIIKAENGGNTSETMDIPYLNKIVNKSDNTEYYPSIQKIGVLQNGDMIMIDMWNTNSLLIFNAKGEELDNISIGSTKDSNYQNFIGCGNNVISIDDEGKVFLYNAESKKIDKSIEFDSGKKEFSYTAYAMKEDGTLFLGDSNGIHRLAKDGTLWETVVDGGLNSMSMPSLIFDSLYAVDSNQEEYYAVYSDNESGYQLVQYVFDKNVSSVPGNEITVYSLRENNTIRQAISLFQSQNADIKVNYVVAMGEEGGNVSDYIRALNTELLSGNGADVLVLDGLSVDSYIEKGVLADISDIINPLKASGDLLANIADNYDINGKVYRMPIRFAVPVMIGSKNALNSSGSVKDIVNFIKQSDLPYSGKTIYKYLLSDYLALYSDEVFENGKLNEEKLADFLNNVKIIAENIKATEFPEEDSGRSGSADSFYGSDILFRGEITGICKKYNMTFDQINNVVDTMIPISIAKERQAAYSTIKQMFLPKGEVGLNSASKDSETAKKFISFLFSKDIQITNLYDGLPVNPSPLKEWFAKEDSMTIGFSDREGNEVHADWPSKDERDAFLKAIMDVKKPVEINYTLNNMIVEEAIPFLTGEADVNQVTAALKAKVNTYLSE